MHMSDALVSPAVAGSLWAVTAGVAAMSARALQRDPDDRRVPLMGVLGAFVFAAQMVNFSIPATGSSGHLGGGLLLSALLGPPAAFLVMASVLTVQALFFADGGLLALGCNIFNLGFLTCFVAYPLIFVPLSGRAPSRMRLAGATVAGAVVGLQLGSLGVVLETVLSGRTDLSFSSFLLLMQPIHLVIGVVEGSVTAALVLFMRESRPDLVSIGATPSPKPGPPVRRVAAAVLLAAAVAGGALSRIASAKPDGLEWSLAHARASAQTGPSAGPAGEPSERRDTPAGLLFARLAPGWAATAERPGNVGPEAPERASSSFSGILGAGLTVAMIALLGSGLRALRRLSRPAPLQ